MKVLYILFILLLSGTLVLAQPTVSVCIENTGTELEVKIQPDASFSGFMANVQLTIVSDDPAVSFATPIGNPLYTTLSAAGTTTAFGGKAYQKYVGFGTAALSVFGTSWTAGEVVTLFTVVPSDLTATFSIGADSWTIDNNGSYYMELNALDKTGSVSSCGSFVLPVTDLFFVARKVAPHKVALAWETQQEINTDYFSLEKSIDGGSFVEIEKQTASGNSQQAQSYQYLDQSLMGTQNDYRLRIVDQDGSYTYSEIESIRWDDQNSLGALYPNPSRDLSHIPLFLAEGQLVQFEVFNHLGQVVAISSQELSSGSHLLDIRTQQLSEGVYQIRLSANGRMLGGQLFEVIR